MTKLVCVNSLGILYRIVAEESLPGAENVESSTIYNLFYFFLGSNALRLKTETCDQESKSLQPPPLSLPMCDVV